MKRDAVLLVAVGSIVILGLYLLKKRVDSGAAVDASGVTGTSKGGLTTTPIKTTVASAFGLLNTATSYATDLARKAIALPGVVNPSGDRMQPFGSVAVAEAAANATLRADYVPNISAVDNVVYLNK
jgi:hypothetical protein